MFYVTQGDDMSGLLQQMQKSKHPVIYPFLEEVLKAIDQIQEPGTRKLCRQIMIWGTWKALYGSSFRPVFVEALYNLSKILPNLPYEQYRKDPGQWKINQYAKMEEKRKRLKGDE